MALLAQSSTSAPTVVAPPVGTRVSVGPRTDLAGRLRLLADLGSLCAGESPAGAGMLAAFTLSGLDAYERKHGRADTLALRVRLARRLVDAVDGAGSAYAIGQQSFAVLARVGRGGSQTIVRACAGALSDDSAGISARPSTMMTPIDMLDPADALSMLLRAGSAAEELAPQALDAVTVSDRLATDHVVNGGDARRSVTVSEARQRLPYTPGHRPGWLPYMRISTRFRLSVLCGVLWVGLSTWLATPWIEQLAQAISLPAAISLIAGLALIPGYLNVQLVSSLLMDHPASIDPDYRYVYPGLTLLVAAYNEQHTIAQTLAYALEQDYPGGLELIVIDDGSGDETAMIAHGFARLDGRLRVLEVAHGGKAAALNAGLRATRTPLVATIDADTLLMPGALRRVVARLLLSPGDTVAVAGSVMVRNSRGGLVSAAQTWDYFLGIASIKRQQALLQGTLVAQGAFSVYDTVALRDAGGWPDRIGEDIVMTWALLKAGGRTTYEPSAVAFTQAPATLRRLARQRRRWARGMIEGLRTYGIALVRGRKTYVHSVIADAMFPYLDFVFTFAFIPGVVLAMTGNFVIVGPMTLAVLPLNALLGSVMYRRQRRSFTEAGLQVRRETVGFVVFFLFYQIFMSPVSVSGYLQEMLHFRRQW